MIKRIIGIGVLLLLVGGVFAQGKLTDAKWKEFEAQKVAFFTKELDLTPEEAAIFWPLYNEMQKKTELIEQGIRKNYREIKEAQNVTEKQYMEAVLKMLGEDERIQKVKKEYYQKMLEVLPASKIWKLNEAERKFRHQLFEKLRKESCRPK